MSRPVLLTLVSSCPVGGQQKNAVPVAWEHALDGWTQWLRLGAMARSSVGLRRHHVASIARRSGTSHPGEVTLALLVELFSEREWSKDHRKAMRTSMLSFGEWCVRNEIMADNPAALLPRVSAPR